MLKSMMLGNEALLNCEKIGFLASRRVPPEAVMRSLDWATRMRDEGVCVMSGFQSPLEKEVLNILLKGTSPLILVLARRMWDERHIPTLFRKPLAEGRLLVVSPVSQSIRRVDAHSAAQRNRYIFDHADSLFLGAFDPSELEEAAWGILLKQIKGDIAPAKFRKRIRKRSSHQRDGIALHRYVSQKQVPEAGRIRLKQKRGGILVREMSIPAANPLLQRNRTRTLLKKHRVMVRLKHRTRRMGEHLPGVRRDEPHVRTDKQGFAVRFDEVPHRICGIVRDRERRYRQFSYPKRLAIPENRPSIVHTTSPCYRICGIAVREERHVWMPGMECGHSTAVVRMIVREQDGRHIACPQSASRHAPRQFPVRQAKVYEYQRSAGTNRQRIASRPAPENAKPHPKALPPYSCIRALAASTLFASSALWALNRSRRSASAVPRICTARSAALAGPALPHATHATGTPDGICTVA